MFIDQYFSEPNGRICFTREQGSNFAKQMANDFNPLHDADAKRFCIPGDLLFAIILARYGISRHMEFVFSGMVSAGVELVRVDGSAEILRRLPQEKSLVVTQTALDAQADAQILRRLCPGTDHPVAIHFPEGDYLKGLLLRRT